MKIAFFVKGGRAPLENETNEISLDDEISFDDLYKKYYFLLLNDCASLGIRDRYDAEELTDDTFSGLYARWNEMNSHSERTLLAWLVRALEYNSTNFFRSEKARRKAMEKYKVDTTLTGCAVRDRYFRGAKTDGRLAKFKETLTPQEELLLNCVLEDDTSLASFARLSGENFNTVKSRWRRLKKKIQNFFEKN